MSDATITFHGGGFVELAFDGIEVFIEPSFSSTRRGRRQRAETRKCDYVFVSRLGEHFDDALDVLEDHDASVLVGPAHACRTARDELRLGRGRTLDLEAWERARDDAMRVTAVPIFAPSPFDDGLSLAEELADSVVGLGRIMEDLPIASSTIRQLRSLSRAPRAGGLALQAGRPGLGWLFQLASGESILHLANGVHEGTDERDLEEVAEISDVDVLVAEATGASVAPIVRATRILAPRAVLLHRSEDPYRRGRRSQALPVTAFADAVGEDQDDDVEAVALRAGDRYIVPAPAPARDVAKDERKAPASVAGNN
jgi:hypothetical protein